MVIVATAVADVDVVVTSMVVVVAVVGVVVGVVHRRRLFRRFGSRPVTIDRFEGVRRFADFARVDQRGIGTERDVSFRSGCARGG